MQNSQNKRTFQIVLLVLVAVLTISIGYASITAINLIINGNATASVNQNNFIVHFIEAKNITGTTGVGGTSIIESDDTKASFNVTGLSKVGDYAEAKYVVKNDSNGIGAEITLELTNSNSEYFKVTETIDDNKLQAGDTTFATVKVEMIKTPIDNDVSTSVTATLTANPLENAEALGGNPSSVVKPEEPKSFATDSWLTIQTAVRNNNTSAYNIGDTRQVDLGELGIHNVRIINKSTPEECSGDDFSQTACGFVVEFADIIELKKMNSEIINDGSWPGTDLYYYVKNNLYNSFPQDLKNVIINTKVLSVGKCLEFNTSTGNYGCDLYENNGNCFVSNDYLYLLSVKEIAGSNWKSNYPDNDKTRQLDFYKNNGITRYTTDPTYIQKKYQNNSIDWWLRNIIVYDYNTLGSFNSYFTASTSCGGISNCLVRQDTEYGVAPAFRIG